MADVSALQESYRQFNTHLAWAGALGAVMDIAQHTVVINQRI